MNLRFIKSVLKKSETERSTEDINKLFEKMMEYRYFKKRKEMTRGDLKELLNMMKFESHCSLTEIFQYNDEGE